MGIRILLQLGLLLLIAGMLLTDTQLLLLSLLPFTILWLSYAFPVKRSAIQLALPTGNVFAGEEVDISLNAKANSAHLLISVEYPDFVASIDQPNCYFAHQTIDIKAKFYVGQGQWPAAVMLGANELGWLTRGYQQRIDEHIEVKPQSHNAPRVHFYSAETYGFAGPILSNNKGTGLELNGIGEYLPGASLKHINWRATAKQIDKLLINEFSLEQITHVNFLIDARRSSYESEATKLFDFSKSATMALAASFDRDGHQQAFYVFGKQWQQQKSTSGVGMLQRLAHTLAETELGNSKVWPQLAQNLPKLVPIGQIIVIISPIQQQDINLYQSIKALGYPCLLVAVDDLALLDNQAQKSEQAQVYLQIKKQQFADKLEQIKKLNIACMHWSVDKPFSQAIFEFQPELRAWLRQLKRR